MTRLVIILFALLSADGRAAQILHRHNTATTTTSTTTTVTTTVTTSSTTTSTTTTTTSTTTTTLIACTSLTMGWPGATSVATGTTASVAPANNALIILAITNNKTGGGDTIQTITYNGTGLTFVCTDSGATVLSSANVHRVTLCRAMGPSVTAGTIKIDFAAAQAQFHWNVIQCTGVDTTGTNGSGAFLNPTVVNQGSVTSATITLPSFTHTADRAVAGFAVENDPATINVGSGFTSLGQQDPFGFLRSITEFGSQNDNTADVSWSGSQDVVGVAVEVKSP